MDSLSPEQRAFVTQTLQDRVLSLTPRGLSRVAGRDVDAEEFERMRKRVTDADEFEEVLNSVLSLDEAKETLGSAMRLDRQSGLPVLTQMLVQTTINSDTDTDVRFSHRTRDQGSVSSHDLPPPTAPIAEGSPSELSVTRLIYSDDSDRSEEEMVVPFQQPDPAGRVLKSLPTATFGSMEEVQPPPDFSRHDRSGSKATDRQVHAGGSYSFEVPSGFALYNSGTWSDSAASTSFSENDAWVSQLRQDLNIDLNALDFLSSSPAINNNRASSETAFFTARSRHASVTTVDAPFEVVYRQGSLDSGTSLTADTHLGPEKPVAAHIPPILPVAPTTPVYGPLSTERTSEDADEWRAVISHLDPDIVRHFGTTGRQQPLLPMGHAATAGQQPLLPMGHAATAGQQPLLPMGHATAAGQQPLLPRGHATAAGQQPLLPTGHAAAAGRLPVPVDDTGYLDSSSSDWSDISEGDLDDIPLPMPPGSFDPYAGELHKKPTHLPMRPGQMPFNPLHAGGPPAHTMTDSSSDGGPLPYASLSQMMPQQAGGATLQPGPPLPTGAGGVPQHLEPLMEEVEGQMVIRKKAFDLLNALSQLGEDQTIDDLGWTLVMSGMTLDVAYDTLMQQISQLQSAPDPNVVEQAQEQSGPRRLTASEMPPAVNPFRRISCKWLEFMHRGERRRAALKLLCGPRLKPVVGERYKQYLARKRYKEKLAQQQQRAIDGHRGSVASAKDDMSSTED